MQKPTLLERTKAFFGMKLNEEESRASVQVISPRPIEVQYQESGTSGVETYSGYYQEEYLETLRGREAASVYDKMRRSDAQVSMVLDSVNSPIIRGTWKFEAGDDSEEQKKITALMEHIFFNDMDKPWNDTLAEILTMRIFGHAVFEVTHKAVISHPKFGNYNGLKAFGWRSPKTIETWNLDKNGRLLSVTQQAYGDLDRLVDIPAKYLVIFTHRKEGDNYEGISMLRPCYGAWLRKNTYLKLMAAGVEKNAFSTPVVTVPEGKENAAKLDNMIEAMSRYMAHQRGYITKPAGWDIEWTNNQFDPEKVKAAIEFENKEIAHAFMAHFLELGQGAGSFALSFDLSDFFLKGIEHTADYICQTMNRTIVKSMVDLNFGAQLVYPKLTCSGISDKAGKDLAEVIKLLVDGKVIVPDDKLEENMRNRYALPKRSMDGQRQVEYQPATQTTPTQDPAQFSETRLQLADPRAQMKDAKKELKLLMQTHLKAIGSAIIEQVIRKWESLPESRISDAIKDNRPKGRVEYETALLDFMAEQAALALKEARKEVPKKKSVKLAEADDLPGGLRKKLKNVTDLLLATQIADLEKAVYFQFISSLELDSVAQVKANMSESLREYIDGPSIESGAGNITADVVNSARNAFFFDDEVFDEIESFTFVNGDPVSEICQALAGTVFDKDDPDLAQYQPPLHHNCRSHLAVNLKGNKNKPITEKDDDWEESVGKAKSSITLSEILTGSVLDIQSIIVSKELAHSLSDAQRIASEYKASVQTYEESEFAYKFTQADSSLFIQGTLKTTDPIKGVTIVYGTKVSTV